MQEKAPFAGLLLVVVVALLLVVVVALLLVVVVVHRLLEDLHHLQLRQELEVAASGLRKGGRLVGCTCRCKGMAFRERLAIPTPFGMGAPMTPNPLG